MSGETNSEAIRAELKDFILGQFPALQGQSLQAGDSLLELGVIDSLGVLDIVTFMEQRYGLTLSDEDMVADHFASIAAMAEMIQARLPADA
jgi:acyl carrier protein